MLMVRAAGVREHSVQTTSALYGDSFVIDHEYNAERFRMQRGVIAGSLPSQIVSLSGFLLKLAGNNSFVWLVHLSLDGRGSGGISPLQMPCTARIECGIQTFSPDLNEASEE